MDALKGLEMMETFSGKMAS